MSTPPGSPPSPSHDHPSRAHDPYAALRLPQYRWFIVSIIAMTTGTLIQTVVVGWQIYAHTHDALSLGLVGLAEALPYIGVALFAGHVADLVNRRTLALVSLLALVLCSAALLLLTTSGAVARPGGLAAIYGIIAVSGVARSFLQPARTALGADIVPRELYPSAVAWRSSSWQAAAVLGPAIGGLLYAAGGPRLAYAVDLALMVVAVVALARVRYAPGPRPPRETGEGILESLAQGLRFVRGQPVILGAMALDLFSVLFGGATALLPIFANDILHVGPQGLGALRAAPAAGAVIVSLLLAHRPPMERAGRALFVNVAAFGLCMIGFALSRSFLLSLALLAVSGGVDMVSVVVRSTLLQLLTPTHLLGRVSSVNAIFIGSSNEIGEFESGVAAKLLGTVPSVLLGGCLTLLVVAVTAWRVPALRRLGRLESAAP